MTQHVLVQLLADNSNNYCWGIVIGDGDGRQQWREPQFTGDKTALLSSLQSIDLAIILVIPGEKVVTKRIAYEAQEKRHLRQLLPYQLEEQIVGDVEHLHFALGPLTNGKLTVAYIDKVWFDKTVACFRDRGFTVSRCVPDFQLLAPMANQWIIWSTGSRILCAHHNSFGFSTHRNMLTPLLADIFGAVQTDYASDIQLYGDSEQELHDVLACLPDTVRRQATQCLGEPPIDPLGKHVVDLCQGSYANRLQLSHWWQALRTTAALAVGALLAFVTVNTLEVLQLKDRQRSVKQQIEKRYRQVIPKGAMGDVVRQLQHKLDGGDASAGKSQVVYLLSSMAPAIKAQKINITTLSYNNGGRELRLNIEANAFNVIEKLRKKLQDKGLQSQLKRSDSRDDTVRARLHIRRAEE